MKDLEPILNILCSYHAGFVLSEDELGILRSWLAESQAHRHLFNELADKNIIQFIIGSTEGNIREKIQERLIAMEEMDG